MAEISIGFLDSDRTVYPVRTYDQWRTQRINVGGAAITGTPNWEADDAGTATNVIADPTADLVAADKGAGANPVSTWWYSNVAGGSWDILANTIGVGGPWAIGYDQTGHSAWAVLIPRNTDTESNVVAWLPVNGGDKWRLKAATWTAAGGTTNDCRLRIDFRNSAGAIVGQFHSLVTTPTAARQLMDTGEVTAPATAVEMQARVNVHTGQTSTETVYFDDWELQRTDVTSSGGHVFNDAPTVDITNLYSGVMDLTSVALVATEAPPEALFHSERVGSGISYTFENLDPATTYRIVVFATENNEAIGTGQRTFDVSVKAVLAKDDWDLYAESYTATGGT